MKSIHSLTLLGSTLAMFSNSSRLLATDIDHTIESSARSSYVFKTYLNDDVKVNSIKGVVTLAGSVDEASYIPLAEDAVSVLPGVKSVDNVIDAKDKILPKYSDEWLAANVKTTLQFHKSVGNLTNVTATNGVISLSGVAYSQAEKAMTSEYALDIDGVSKVINNMTIAPIAKDIKTSTGRTIDDASICAMIKSALLSHRSTSGLEPSVKSTDGVVTLSGEANNEAEINSATKIALDTRGTKQVINTMTVKQKK